MKEADEVNLPFLRLRKEIKTIEGTFISAICVVALQIVLMTEGKPSLRIFLCPSLALQNGDIMKKIVKKGYLLPVAVMYAFFIVITIVFIFIYRREHNVKTQGIPIQCEILSVTQEWESDNDLLEGGIYQDITCVKYKIDGVEYTDTIKADLGETGDEIELIYLPSNPEKVYSLIVMESGSEIMKYIAIGWFVYWLFMTVLLIFIMIRNKRKKDLRNENHIYLT